MKFRYLKIDLESNITYNCHAASPENVDFLWLDSNPGRLFHNKTSVHERTMMLANQRATSCQQNCWAAEDRGAISPRLWQGGDIKSHTDVYSELEILDLTFPANCNLTCTYCSKENSTSWRRDLEQCGPYPVSDVQRYSLTDRERVLLKISQNEIQQSTRYKKLLEEVRRLSPSLKKLIITGGEPLLFNSMIDTLKSLDLAPDAVVEIYTGLGLDHKRFDKLTDQLADIKGLKIRASGENVGKRYEFNRYGNSWHDFLEKINLLKNKNISFDLFSTLSNLTVMGYGDFYRYFIEQNKLISFVYTPRMMAPYVLDDQSKQDLMRDIEDLSDDFKQKIIDSIESTPTAQERRDIGAYLKRFIASRPDLDVSVFPSSFLNWIDHVV